MDTGSINKRYSELAGSSCCLSCGTAVSYASARKGEVCVDLGSGRGIDVMRLAFEVGENGFVFGIDVSDGMLKTAQMHAEKLNLRNVSFLRSDLEKICLPMETADLVISNCTINHADDKARVWGEVYRILREGGRFVVSDIYALQPVPQEFRSDPVAVAECWAGAVQRAEYMQTLVDSGFTGIEVMEESEPYVKGRIQVASFTVSGRKPSRCCCSS